jgi:hypothetical protein
LIREFSYLYSRRILIFVGGKDMAKNLMADSLQGPPTPWKLRTAEPGFGYAGGVRNIQVAYTGL